MGPILDPNYFGMLVIQDYAFAIAYMPRGKVHASGTSDNCMFRLIWDFDGSRQQPPSSNQLWPDSRLATACENDVFFQPLGDINDPP